MSEDRSFDVVIAGGAAVGCAVGYFLKGVEQFSGSVAIVERDPTFSRAATTLSCASIRQQFSTAENIRLSRFGLDFLRGLTERFGREAEPSLREGGYLILATDGGKDELAASHRTQIDEGAPVALMGRDALADRFAVDQRG